MTTLKQPFWVICIIIFFFLLIVPFFSLHLHMYLHVSCHTDELFFPVHYNDINNLFKKYI